MLTWSSPASPETQFFLIQSASLLPLLCVFVVTKVLVPRLAVGSAMCPPSHTPSKCPVNGASLPFPLAFSSLSSSA